MAVRLDALGIVVTDLTASAAFYRKLGLDFPTAGEGHLEATSPTGIRVMLDTEAVMASFDPTWRPPRERGRIGLAFLCDSPAEVDDLVAALAGEGHAVHLEPFDAPWGQRYASVLDPDGNVVDLFAPL